MYHIPTTGAGYCSISPTPGNASSGAGDGTTASANRAHFQGRVVPSPAPKDLISRGGQCHQPPLEMYPIFRGGQWHQPSLENHFQGRLVMPPASEKHNKYLAAHHLPPPDRTVFSRGRCCPNFPYIINRGEFLYSISLKLEALGGKQHLILCFF